MKIVTVDVPIIPFTFRVLIFDNVSELLIEYKEYSLEDLEGFHAGVFMENVPTVALKTSDVNEGIIVHESNHLLNKCFRYIKQDLDVNNDEIQSYFLQYFFNTINDIYKTAEAEKLKSRQ